MRVRTSYYTYPFTEYRVAVLCAIHTGDVQAAYLYARMSAREALNQYDKVAA